MNIQEIRESSEWQVISDLIRKFEQKHFNTVGHAVTLHLPYLQPAVMPLSMPGLQAQPVERYPRRKDPDHTTDYQLVWWGNRKYTFAPKQRLVVKKLWEAWESGRPEVEQRALLAAAESECVRLHDLFRDHAAWGSLIVSPGRTLFRLAFPTEEEVAEAANDFAEGQSE